MLCVLILYIKGGTYSLKPTPNDRFLKKLFMTILFTQSFCQKSAEKKSPKKYFLYLVLMTGLWFELWSLRLISQHQGEFIQGGINITISTTIQKQQAIFFVEM